MKKIYELVDNDGLQLKDKKIKNEIERKIKNNEKIFFKKDNHYYKLTEKHYDTCDGCDLEDVILNNKYYCQDYGCIACSLGDTREEIYYILKEKELYEIVFGENKNEDI